MQHDNSISMLIQNVASLLYKQSEQVLQEQLGIGMAQFRILTSVQANPRLLQRHIAQALDQTEASISRQVKILHGKRLLITLINPQNRREHITSLTAKGIQTTDAAIHILHTSQAPLVGSLSKNQQRELAKLLSMLKHSILVDTNEHQAL